MGRDCDGLSRIDQIGVLYDIAVGSCNAAVFRAAAVVSLRDAPEGVSCLDGVGSGRRRAGGVIPLGGGSTAGDAQHCRLRPLVSPEGDRRRDVVGAVILAPGEILNQHLVIDPGAGNDVAQHVSRLTPALQCVQVIIRVCHRARGAKWIKLRREQCLDGGSPQGAGTWVVGLSDLVKTHAFNLVSRAPGVAAGRHGEHQLPAGCLVKKGYGSQHQLPTPAASARSKESAIRAAIRSMSLSSRTLHWPDTLTVIFLDIVSDARASPAVRTRSPSCRMAR